MKTCKVLSVLILFIVAIPVAGQNTALSNREVMRSFDGQTSGFGYTSFSAATYDEVPSGNSYDNLRDWNRGIGYIGFSVGGEFPFGSLQTVENRLGGAISLGFGWKHIIFGAELFQSNTTTSNPVTINQAGVEWSSNKINYSGLAATIGYAVYEGRLHLLEANIGFGYNTVDLVGPPTENKVATHTYSTSFGLSYKYCVWGFVFVGSEIRYYINDFSNNTGTNLNGNSLALRLTFGIQGMN